MQLVLLLVLFACVLQTGLAQDNVHNVTNNFTAMEDSASSETTRTVVRTTRFSAGDIEMEDFPMRLHRSPGERDYQQESPPSSGRKKYVSAGREQY